MSSNRVLPVEGEASDASLEQDGSAADVTIPVDDGYTYDLKNSPFLDFTSPRTWWEVVKLVVLGPLAVLRFLLILLTLCLLSAVGTLLSIGIPDDDPLPPWRFSIMKVLYPALCRTMLLLAGYWWIPVEGRQHIREAKAAEALIVINHVAVLDGVLLEATIPCAAVGKAAIAKLPVVGSIGRGARCLWAHRSTTMGSLEAKEGGAPSMTQRLKERARDARQPLTFLAPEATTSNGHQLLMFKTGAFATGQPVVPTLLKFPHQRLNPAMTYNNDMVHIFRMCCQFYNSVSVTFLPIYYPSKEEQANPKVYAANVRQLMAERLQIPLVEQGLDEVFCMNEANIFMSWDGRTVTGDVELLNKLTGELQKKRASEANAVNFTSTSSFKQEV